MRSGFLTEVLGRPVCGLLLRKVKELRIHGLRNIDLKLLCGCTFLPGFIPEFLVFFEVVPFRCLHGSVNSASLKLKLPWD